MAPKVRQPNNKMLTKRKVKWTTEYLVSHGNCLAVAVRNDCLIDIYESGLIFHMGRSRHIKAKFVEFRQSNKIYSKDVKWKTCE